MRLDSRLLPALFGAIVVIAACSDSTRPDWLHPLAGRWELTTHFDTFSFETGAPSPPDCPGFTEYCTHYRTTTAGAYLGGTLELMGSNSKTDRLSDTVYASGTLQVSFCDSIDRQGLTGCAHVSDRAAIEYRGTIVGSPNSPTPSLLVNIGEPGDGFGLQRVMRTYSLKYSAFAGDSIYGPIYWGEGGRSPPSYRGTFVMRRVR